MNQGEFIAQLLGTIALISPVALLLWKLNERFNHIERSIDAKIAEVQAGMKLAAREVQHIDDKVLLGINGAKEKADHVGMRSKIEHDALEKRVDQVEHWLQKNTKFEIRS